MTPSSTLCRAQEAFHRDRAASSGLENVRRIATNAADAWGLEALSAERREARHLRVREVADLTAAKALKAIAARDCLASENPDRGYESI